jgi:hypothetical protein
MKPKLLIFTLVLGILLPTTYILAGVVLSSSKYAWSDNVGYINFENVTVGDTKLSGSAWSKNKGFINLNPANGGVLNDGAGNLSGSAWGEQLGWIDFSSVKINTNGKFSGTATGTLVGTITFDCHFCDVETDWRIAASPAPIPNTNIVFSGGGGHMIFPNSQNSLNSNNNVNNISSNNTPVALINNNALSPNLGKIVPVVSKIVTSSNKNTMIVASLFDVISEPVQPAKPNVVPFVVISIFFEIVTILLIIFVLKRIRTFLITKKMKNENKNETI